MGKFKEIKIGDKVSLVYKVSISPYKNISFNIHKKVIRITKTQFIVEGELRFSKKSGLSIPNGYVARSIDGVEDESVKMANLKKKIDLKISLEVKMHELTLELRDSKNFIDNSNNELILNIINSIETLLNLL